MPTTVIFADIIVSVHRVQSLFGPLQPSPAITPTPTPAPG
jgi:hypothetical protein